MELVVDLSSGGVTLRGREDLRRFSVHALPRQPGDGPADGALGALAAALSVHQVGTVGPDGDVLVTAAALRRLAEGAATADGSMLEPRWDHEFRAMVEYATTQGWTSEDGSLRAHVEWGD